MLLVVLVRAFVLGSVSPGLDAFAVFFVVPPVPLVRRTSLASLSVNLNEISPAMGFSENPVSFMDVAICFHKRADSVRNIVFPVPGVLGPIFNPNLGSLPVLLVADPLACIHISCLG